MASSPCSPAAPVCQNFGPLEGQGGRALLPLTTNCPTPGASVLRTNARRVVQNSVAKGLAASARPLQNALDHFSLFDKVTSLEAENMELKIRVRDLTEQLGEATERAATAEASAAAAAQGTHAAHDGAAEGAGWAAGGNLSAAGLSQASQPELLARLAALEQELLSCQADRRKAHDQVVEMRGRIRVLCRVRPTQGEAAVRTPPDGATVGITCHGQDASFAFSRVFPPSSSTEQVFGEVSELVQSSMDGYSVCLMSYGQTGSGKTHSMLGGQQDPRGIIPRALDNILSQTQRLSVQGWLYTLEASCMELYNNSVRDLLAPAGQQDTITDMNAIKHDANGTTVVGVSRHAISSVNQALSLLSRATSARACGSTACNTESSRSHCVFWLHVKGTHAAGTTQLTGALCLVDLAGSERLERSQAVGGRKAEAAAINTSLSALGDVFEALATKRAHVPYRNSKLTYLLKSCLSPGGKTLFLVHVNPEAASAHESLTSLRFATKVAGTELGPAKKGWTEGGWRAEDGGGGRDRRAATAPALQATQQPLPAALPAPAQAAGPATVLSYGAPLGGAGRRAQPGPVLAPAAARPAARARSGATAAAPAVGPAAAAAAGASLSAAGKSFSAAAGIGFLSGPSAPAPAALSTGRLGQQQGSWGGSSGAGNSSGLARLQEEPEGQEMAAARPWQGGQAREAAEQPLWPRFSGLGAAAVDGGAQGVGDMRDGEEDDGAEEEEEEEEVDLRAALRRKREGQEAVARKKPKQQGAWY